ncbi:MAG: SAM-dependent methyltransferase [Polyangiaceae bacterium]
MSPFERPDFVFVLVQPEATAWFKREHPELVLAFSRPGLLTFKNKQGHFAPDHRLETAFARHWGFSLGRATEPADVLALVDDALSALARGTAEPLRLHVYSRDEGESGQRLDPVVLDAVREQISSAGGERFLREPTPREGDLVLDVILSPPRVNSDAGVEPISEPWFIGWHRHTRERSLLPGGVSRATAPERAPSRAWCKLEELLAWSGLPVRAGQTAVEIGCAPGGAVVNLVERGLHVIGIDPGAMDDGVAVIASSSSGSFEHLALKVGAVKREQLPAKVDWLLCDANLAPTVTLRYLAYWSKQLRPHLRGILFTLKLNDDRMVESVPKLLARCGELGFGKARAVQLPSHRREIAVIASKRHR